MICLFDYEKKNLPKKIVIYGAGYIACEFASIFNGLGADVTLVYRGENLLRGFDYDISSLVRQGLEDKGINDVLSAVIENVTKCSKGLSVALSNNSRLDADEVVCATGRKPNIENLGLEELGFNLEKGAVLVDEYQRRRKLREKTGAVFKLSLIHISEPTRQEAISYAVLCL